MVWLVTVGFLSVIIVKLVSHGVGFLMKRIEVSEGLYAFDIKLRPSTIAPKQLSTGDTNMTWLKEASDAYDNAEKTRLEALQEETQEFLYRAKLAVLAAAGLQKLTAEVPFGKIFSSQEKDYISDRIRREGLEVRMFTNAANISGWGKIKPIQRGGLDF